MKIVFLGKSLPDLKWMWHYYSQVFPAGKDTARKHFNAAKAALKRNPLIGVQTSVGDARELGIAKTPFSFVYRIVGGTIQVLRVWDGRRDSADKYTGL